MLSSSDFLFLSEFRENMDIHDKTLNDRLTRVLGLEKWLAMSIENDKLVDMRRFTFDDGKRCFNDFTEMVEQIRNLPKDAASLKEPVQMTLF